MFRSLVWSSILQYLVIALACLVAFAKASEARTHRHPAHTALARG
jgi:hypothetical protein